MLSNKYKKEYIVSPHPKCPIEKYKKYFDEGKLNFDQEHMTLLIKAT